MDEPDFDDDELINDYVEDDFEPDYTYDDEMVDEMIEQQEQASTQPSESVATAPPPIEGETTSGQVDNAIPHGDITANPVPAPRLEEEQQQRVEASDDEDEDTAVRNYISRHSGQNDLYTFDMYVTKWMIER